MKVGQGITVSGPGSDGQFLLTVQTLSMRTGRRALSEFGSAPEKGRYLGILIQYNCVSGPCDYNPFDFTLRNLEGEEFSTGFESFEPNLQSGNLGTGRKAKGYITYDVPPGKYLLEYRSNLLDENAATWNVAVS